MTLLEWMAAISIGLMVLIVVLLVVLLLFLLNLDSNLAGLRGDVSNSSIGRAREETLKEATSFLGEIAGRLAPPRRYDP